MKFCTKIIGKNIGKFKKSLEKKMKYKINIFYPQ